VEHCDKVHEDEDGHVLMMIKLNLENKKEKTQTKKIKAKVYDRFLFCTQDTIEGVSDLESIAVL
jgi:Sec7-like guanine-nucleotide exchange factor